MGEGNFLIANDKIFVTADELYDASIDLTEKILESGFKPDFLVALWRGGTPVGIYIHEILSYLGMDVDHIAIRTSRYGKDNVGRKKILVHGLSYIVEHANHDDSLLVVDDVMDEGHTLDRVLKDIRERMKLNTPHDIRIATVFYKPKRNETDIVPDYHLYETSRWIYFPHELMKLKRKELVHKGPKMVQLIEKFGKQVK